MPGPRRRPPRPGCPFCFEELPRPEPLAGAYSMDEVLGGRCLECGAWFVVDETGKSGGVAVMNLLVLLAGGDLQRALSFNRDADYQMKTVPWRGTLGRLGDRATGQMPPQAWAARLVGRAAES